jgi:hypothetical protein
MHSCMHSQILDGTLFFRGHTIAKRVLYIVRVGRGMISVGTETHSRWRNPQNDLRTEFSPQFRGFGANTLHHV